MSKFTKCKLESMEAIPDGEPESAESGHKAMDVDEPVVQNNAKVPSVATVSKGHHVTSSVSCVSL